MATPQRKNTMETAQQSYDKSDAEERARENFRIELFRESETALKIALDTYNADGDRGGTGPLGVLKAAITKREIQKKITRTESRKT